MAKQLSKKFIGNNEVDGSKILLENGQSIKIKDSTGTEVELVKLGASDEVLVSGQEVALKQNLDQEVIDREAAILQVLGDAQDYTDQEYTALESTLSASISAEETARIAGDASTLASANTYTQQVAADIQTEVNSLSSSLDDSVGALTVTDQGLQAQIDAITGGGSGSLSAVQSELDDTQVGAGLETNGSYTANGAANFISSATSLKSADELLDAALKLAQDEINAIEVGAGLDSSGQYAPNGGSNYLQSAISLFDADVILDSTLKGAKDDIAQEISDRIAADANLQSQIDNVLSNVDGSALDSLTEIVSAFQAADASLNGAITSLSTGLSADIDAEEAARIAADSALQGEIDAEEIARAAADTTLQNNIDSEASARQSADDALDVRVDVLESVTNKKQKFAMSNQQTSITLDHAPIAGSLMIFVDQVPMHESIDAGASDDWSVSGTTVTFINDYSATGNKKMQNNDTVYVKYQYLA